MGDFHSVEAQQLRLSQYCKEHEETPHAPTLPSPEALRAAEATLPDASSASYLAQTAADEVVRHITADLIPALNGQGRSSRYFGFVTGGVLPVAEWADNVVSHFDQNVQVHLPSQTIATAVEDAALGMLAALLGLGLDGTQQQFHGRIFTTGATSSNILGLASGREAILARKLGASGGGGGDSVGELGTLGACVKAGVEEIQVLTSAGHSSLSKAASVVGLGRASVKELRKSDAEPWRLDLDAVEEYLKKPRIASIIAVSAGEVNTGRYALTGLEEMQTLRKLADKYGAWIHVDGAFGIFARALPETQEFKTLRERSAGIELADSITVDGHKALNVPYDCGMFFTRSAATLQGTFSNPNAVYLSPSGQGSIPSPLNLGLENSRRFRALPAYAVLRSEGRAGFHQLLSNMARLSRQLAAFLRDSPHYELLPNDDMDEVFMIVLFRAKEERLNDGLVEKINGTRQMYLSGTSWKGAKAVRIAVSNWKVDVERDYKAVTTILTALGEGKEVDTTSW